MVSKAHFKRLSAGLRELWEENYLTDIEITTADNPVKLHQVILFIFSNFNRENTKSVPLLTTTFSSNEVNTFLKFLYDGETEVKKYFPDLIKELKLDLTTNEDVKKKYINKKDGAKQTNIDMELKYLRDLVFETSVARLMKDEFPGSDVTLKTKKKLHNCHKVILAAASPYFKAMFISGMKESEDNIINLESVDSDSFALIIKYIYSGKLKISGANIQDLLSTSCYIQINPVQTLCEEFLLYQIDQNNCVDIWNLGVMYDISDLQKKAKAYILDNFVDVSASKLATLPLNEMIGLLQDDNLNSMNTKQVFNAHEDANVLNETEILKFLLRWMTKAALKDEDYHKVLSYVRFSFIPKDFIEQLLSHNSVIRKSSACTDLLRKALEESRTQDRPRNEKALLILKGSASATKLDVACFSFRQGKWFRLQSAKTLCGTAFGVCITTSGKDLYLTGGSAHPKSCHHFSVETNMWSTKADMNEGRSSHGVGFVGDSVYVLGGFSAYVDFDLSGSIEKYDTKTDSWRVVSQLQIPTYDSACSVVKSKIYLFGGTMTVIPGSYVKDIQCFDTVTETCTVLYHNLPMPLSLGVAVACSDNRDIFIACPRGDILHYSEESAPTVLHPASDNGRMGFGVAFHDNKVYVMGGYNQSASTCISYYDLQKKMLVQSKMKLPFDKRPHQLFATVANISRGHLTHLFSPSVDLALNFQQLST